MDKRITQKFLVELDKQIEISGLSQNKIAKKIGYASGGASIQNIRNGTTQVKLEKLKNFCNLFNYDFKSEQKINFQLKSIASFLGIKKRLFFHVARHSFATNYLESGGKIENLQVILGHTSIVTTMKYVHVLKENAALTVNLI